MIGGCVFLEVRYFCTKRSSLIVMPIASSFRGFTMGSRMVAAFMYTRFCKSCRFKLCHDTGARRNPACASLLVANRLYIVYRQVFEVPYILQLEPSLDAFRLRSDVISSKMILSLLCWPAQDWTLSLGRSIKDSLSLSLSLSLALALTLPTRPPCRHPHRNMCLSRT